MPLNKIRKTAIKRILLIILPLAPAAYLILSENKSQSYLIKLPVAALVIVALWNFAMLMQELEAVINDLFPPKNMVEKKVRNFDMRIYRIAAISPVIGMGSLLVQANQIDNTVRGLRLFWISGLSGIVICILFLILLNFISSTIYDNASRRNSIVAAFLLAFFTFAPAVVNYTNRLFAKPGVVCKKFNLYRKGKSSDGNCYIFFIIEGQKERITTNLDFYDKLQEGDTVELCIQKGYWDYSYLTDIRKP